MIQFKIKYVFILLTNIFSVVFATAQNVFDLTIKVPDKLNGDTLYIGYDNGKDFINKSLIFNNGTCNIRDTFFSPFSTIYLTYRKTSEWSSAGIFVSNHPAKIVCTTQPTDTSIFKNAIFKNVFFRNIEASYEKYVAPEDKEYKEYYLVFKELKWPDSLRPILRAKKAKHFFKVLDFVEKNDQSYFSFYVFKSFITTWDYISSDSLLNFYDTHFNREYKENIEGKKLRDFLLGKINVGVDKPAPLFAATDLRGKDIALNKLKGKYGLIIFWASWCGPCVKEIPFLRSIRRKYSSKKLEMISVSLDKNDLAWRKAVAKHKVTWTNLRDRNISASYGVTFIPQIFLIDKEGKIIYSTLQSNDSDDLKVLIEKLTKVLQ